MLITKSDKIDPPGYCIAVAHDNEDLDIVNHASKSDILKVIFCSVCYMPNLHIQQLREVGSNP